MRFLTFALQIFLSLPNFAQGIPTQETWTDGVTAGDSLNLWLFEDASKPDERKLYACRLAGIVAPREIVAGVNYAYLTRQMEWQSTLALANLTSAQTLVARVINTEKYETCPPSTKLLPGCETRTRLVIVLTVKKLNLKGQDASEDAALAMLRVGLAYVPRIAELSPQEAATYQAQQDEAQRLGRGIWRYCVACWQPEPLERETGKPAMPTRRK
jgi:hypothetical protein